MPAAMVLLACLCRMQSRGRSQYSLSTRIAYSTVAQKCLQRCRTYGAIRPTLC